MITIFVTTAVMLSCALVTGCVVYHNRDKIQERWAMGLGRGGDNNQAGGPDTEADNSLHYRNLLDTK